MTERVDYHVNAWLQTRGDFAKQMARQASHVDHLQRRLDALGSKSASVGRMMMGTTLETTRGYLRTGAALGVMAAGGGFLTLVRQGTEFNAVLEEGRNSLGAMFQLYKQNGGDMEANLRMAAGAQRQLFDLAKKSPVEFQDAVNIYQGAASGLIVANQSMQEQMEFMRGAQMLGAVVPDLESGVIGGQLGRILMGGAGAEFEVWKRLAPSILEAGQATGVFSRNMRMGQKFTQEFNKLAQAQPEVAAGLLKTAVEPLKDMQERFEKSWGGILSTTKSNMKVVAAAFTGPFHEMRKRVLYELNKTGLFSESNLARLEHIATVLGVLFSGVMERAFKRLMSWVTFLRDNWESITTTLYSVGQQVAMLIKGAFFMGVARMAAGASLVAAGKGLSAASSLRQRGGAAASWIAGQRRRFHTGMARGALGKGGSYSAAGGMGEVMKAIAGKNRGVLRTMLSVGSLLSALAAGATVVAGLTAGFLALTVVAGGIAAYIISNWQYISQSIIDGLESGKISLVPFLVAMYTFWERLKAVGQALLGGTTGADMFTGAMKMGITAFNLMGDAIAMTMKGIAISIGIWGALRLAFQGLMWVILQMIDLMGMIPKIGLDAETVARAHRNYDNFARGTQDVFTDVDQLLRDADKIANIDVSALDMEDINRKAEEWKKTLVDGLKDSQKKKTSPKGPQVHVENVTINQDLRDHDPDRLMASFVKPMQSLADRRVQAWDQLDMGE